jgi:hypothetical protein
VDAENEASEAIRLANRFFAYIVANEDQYSEAGIDLQGIKLRAKELDALRKTMTKPLDDSKKRIMALFAVPLEALEKAESSIKTAMLGWQRKQEAIRQAEENRLRELQRKEEDRIRAEQEKIQKQAEAAMAEGKTEKAFDLAEKADALTDRAAIIANAVPVVESKVQKVSGISTRKIWKYRIIDPLKVPREYLIVDEVKLGKTARASAGTIKIDGVEFYAEDSIAAG